MRDSALWDHARIHTRAKKNGPDTFFRQKVRENPHARADVMVRDRTRARTRDLGDFLRAYKCAICKAYKCAICAGG